MDFSDWTLTNIREEGSSFSWMEEHRFNWIPQVNNALKKILNGFSIIVVTDREFNWLGDYIVNKLNSKEKNRPYIPIYNIDCLFSAAYKLNDTTELDLLYDMFDISFSNGYLFWYIGNGEHRHYEYIEQNKSSIIWRLNHEVEGLFSLKRGDPQIDIKLIQAFKLFDKAIDAAITGDIEL